MSVFMLETDAVSSAASSIGSLASQVSNLSSTVSGYDTSCEDDFDFASAKNVISQNIEACSIKMKSTSNIMESVVNSHTQLQSSLTFNYGKEDASATSSTGGSSSNGYSGGGYSGGGYSGGGYYPSSGGGVGVIPGPTKPGDEEEGTTEEEDDSRIGEVKTELTEVGYAYADEDKLSDASKTLLNSKDCSYDEDGYAKIGDYYVITADASVGKVGDLIKFTKADGTVVACVIGINTKSDKYKNKINFIVDKEKSKDLKTNDTVKNLLKDNEKVENLGNYKEVKETDLPGKGESEDLRDGDTPSQENPEGEKPSDSTNEGSTGESSNSEGETPNSDSNTDSDNKTEEASSENTETPSSDNDTSGSGYVEEKPNVTVEEGTPSDGYDINTDSSKNPIVEEEEEV